MVDKVKLRREARAELAAAEKDEASANNHRWAAAERMAALADSGDSHRVIAEHVGLDQRRVGRYIAVWRRHGGADPPHRPRWTDAMIEEDPAQSAESMRRRAVRQVAREEPEVIADAAVTLPAEVRRDIAVQALRDDPDIAEQAARAILDGPSSSSGFRIRRVAREAEARDVEDFARGRAQARRVSDAAAMPLPAHLAGMAIKMREWARALETVESDIREMVEDGRFHLDSLASSAALLAEHATRVSMILNPATPIADPMLVVIDGTGTDGGGA